MFLALKLQNDALKPQKSFGPRRTEELQVIRSLESGVQQFVCQLPGERPPHTSSLWVTADGYFYSMRLEPADVSHRSFKTPTFVLKVLPRVMLMLC